MRHLHRILLLAVLGCAMLALTAYVTQAASAGNEKTPGVPTSCLLWAPVPTPDTGGYPWQVVAVNPAHAWALSAEAPDRTNVLFWNGTAWAVRLTANLNGSFASTSANDAWVISRDQGVLHWNGSTWSVSLPGFVDGWLQAGGPNDIWVARDWNSGSGYTHWDGLHWTTIPDLVRVYSIRASAVGFPNHLWLVGGAFYPNDWVPAQATYWDGTTWQSLTDPRIIRASSSRSG